VYLLANNRDIQQQLYAEITRNCRQTSTAAAAAAADGDTSPFKYLNCVIKEALR